MKTLQLLQSKFEECKTNMSGVLQPSSDLSKLDKVMENIDKIESELYDICLQVLAENYKATKEIKMDVDDEDEFNKDLILNQELILYATENYVSKYKADLITFENTFIHMDLGEYFNDKVNYFKKDALLNILDCVEQALSMTLHNRITVRHDFLVQNMGEDGLSYHANLLKSQMVLLGSLESVGGYSLVNSIYKTLKESLNNKEVGFDKDALDGFKDLVESVFSRRPEDCTDVQFTNYMNEMYEEIEKSVLMCSVHIPVEKYKEYFKNLAQGIRDILNLTKEHNLITEATHYDVISELKQMEKLATINS